MPPRFVIGDTLTSTVSLAGYPAGAGWVLHYRLVPRDHGGAAVTFSSSASGDDHLITVLAATTAGWAAGAYAWASWVVNGAQSFSLEQGTTQLLPNPRTTSAGPLDLRTPAQIALDNVRATIQGKATADVLKYEINGRSLERYPMRELIALETHLSTQVNREARTAALAAGKPDTRRYQVRLGRA
jgi:hypothetical protein